MTLYKILISLILLLIIFSTGCDKNKSITFLECEEAGGNVIGTLTFEEPQCPEGQKKLGEISDAALWKICCK